MIPGDAGGGADNPGATLSAGSGTGRFFGPDRYRFTIDPFLFKSFP